jgi:hypothetical protein
LTTAGAVGTGGRSLDWVIIITVLCLAVSQLLLIGSLLGTNLIKAKEMASKQRKVANDFEATFPPDTIRQWKRMVRKWEAKSSNPNPYVSKDRGRFFI